MAPVATHTVPGHALVLAAGSVLDLDPLEQIEVAAGAGFAGLGLRLGPEITADLERLDAVRDQARDHGVLLHDLEVIRIGADGEYPADANALFAAAARLGIASVLAVSDHDDLRHTIAELERLRDRGGDHGVEVVFEYMAWTTPSTVADALRVADATGCRVVLDVLHHHRVGGTLDDAATIIDAGHLAWLQLCDGPLIGPDTPEGVIFEARHARATPGHGEFDLASYLALVTEPSVISVEVQADTRWAQMTPEARATELFEASTALIDAV